MAGAAGADPLSFGGGARITSKYVDEGISQSGNSPAFQTWLEFGGQGFYGGLWATTLKDADGNRAELDLSAGYRGETAGGIGYDLGYTQHLYDVTHGFSAEIAAGASFPVADALSVIGEVSYDLGERSFGQNLGLEFSPSDSLVMTAEVGRADPASDPYLTLGLEYLVTNHLGMDMQVQDTTSTNPVAAIGLSYRFGAQGE